LGWSWYDIATGSFGKETMNSASRQLFSAILITGGLALWSSSFGASVSTVAISDAFVATGPTGNLSNNNYGGGGALALATAGLTNGEFQSVIKFDFSGARASLDAQFGSGLWSIQSVSLQLTSSPHNNTIYNDIGPGLFGVSLMQNNGWIEGTGNASSPASNGISYNTLQNTFVNNAADELEGTFHFAGGASGANTYSLDLTAGLTGDILAGGIASLRLFAADNRVSYLFTSRSGSGSSQPSLIIAAIPEPTSLALFGLLAVIALRGKR
jgi:hypothetical protein